MTEHVILFGAPGSGKGTQSALLQKCLGLQHLSTGELLREEIRQNTPLGNQVKHLIESGTFVPDEVILEIIDHIISEVKPEDKGFIFDGFPRTAVQAEGLDRILSKYNQKISFFIRLYVPKEELTQRLQKRAQAENRADDTPETIARRLDIYGQTAQAIQEHYEAAGLSYMIDGHGTPEEITQRILEVMGKDGCVASQTK